MNRISKNPGAAGGRPWASGTDFVVAEISTHITSQPHESQTRGAVFDPDGMPIIAAHWLGLPTGREVA